MFLLNSIQNVSEIKSSSEKGINKLTANLVLTF